MIRRALFLSTLTAVMAAGGALAAEKAKTSNGVCALGKGKQVCCKAYVADHCKYVSCCEVGNAAFYTASRCHTCAPRATACAGSSCSE